MENPGFNKLINALKEAHDFLENSKDSMYAADSVEEIKSQITKLIKNLKDKQVDKKEISFLFLPTGSLQDISLDNNWADDFLRIGKEIDSLLA